jgi:hypothetical protein
VPLSFLAWLTSGSMSPARSSEATYGPVSSASRRVAGGFEASGLVVVELAREPGPFVSDGPKAYRDLVLWPVRVADHYCKAAKFPSKSMQPGRAQRGVFRCGQRAGAGDMTGSP